MKTECEWRPPWGGMAPAPGGSVLHRPHDAVAAGFQIGQGTGDRLRALSAGQVRVHRDGFADPSEGCEFSFRF